MIDLNLSPTAQDAYEAALLESHRIRITVTIRDRNERRVANLQAPKVLTGAVHVDTDADVSRSLSLSLLDPQHKLQFDGDNPANGAVYADNFVSIEYGVWVSDISRWVDVPVFFGPLTAFSRTGPEVTLEAQGKETLGLDPHLAVNGYTIPKGTTVAKAIRGVMGRLGEQSFALGMISGRLHKHRTVTRGESPWMVCVGGSQDANGHPKPSLMSKAGGHFLLFYDGRGKLTAKRRSASSKWTFNGRQLTSRPSFSYDIMEVRNHVVVTGGTPEHSKRHYRGSATLPAAHPLSATSLARRGKKRYLVTFFTSDSLKSDAACRAKAQEILSAHTHQGVEASFECLPIPHLEELDSVTLKIDGYSVTFPVRSFSIPLTSDSAMTVGFTRQVKPHLRRHRRRKGR